MDLEDFELIQDCDSDLNPVWEIHHKGTLIYRYRNEIEARKKLEELREEQGRVQCFETGQAECEEADKLNPPDCGE